MHTLQFTNRNELSDYSWDTQKEAWTRPKLEKETLHKLSQRSTVHGLLRVCFLFLLLGLCAFFAWFFYQKNFWWLAVPTLYVYFFFFGFLVALGHELQHKTVFAKGADWFSEILFFIVQTLMWNSPTYARISHKLHHRYTMVSNMDPETDWPIPQTSKWIKSILRGMVLKILVVQALVDFVLGFGINIKRTLGIKDSMMQNHCTKQELRVIRIESFFILVIHSAVILFAILSGMWQLLVFITIAWHIGIAFELFWHLTQHISRLNNVNDQRLCTRSVKVNPLIRLIYFGLDDHVEHHLFPVVPSKNLPKLKHLLKNNITQAQSMIRCWSEMIAVSLEKDKHPEQEYVPYSLNEEFQKFILKI